RAYLCHRHLLFKGWLKQPNPSNQKRIMQIPSSKCRASGFVQSDMAVGGPPAWQARARRDISCGAFWFRYLLIG
ncbi:hypothetical protein, partial [Rhizobium leguminosarum]|uniref:hypothetical protein n=1 Tax=Rhizobium leguminosarum TaxID=384 RepID=UPI001C983072